MESWVGLVGTGGVFELGKGIDGLIPNEGVVDIRDSMGCVNPIG